MSTDIVPVPVLAKGDAIEIHSSQRGALESHVPSIVSALTQFRLGTGVLEAERRRYEELAQRRPLSAAEQATRAAHDALAAGRVLVDIQTVLDQRHAVGSVAGLVFPYPKLAVARLGDPRVTCRLYDNGLVQFRATSLKVILELQTRTPVNIDRRRSAWGNRPKAWVSRDAVAPSLPPELVGKVEPRDKILVWEATWINADEPAPRRVRPVRDPALLEHVAGSLYAVVAVWELSPVEAAVLGPSVG